MNDRFFASSLDERDPRLILMDKTPMDCPPVVLTVVALGAGTPLREGIKAARLRLNEAVNTGRAHYSMVEETVQDKLDTSRAHTAAMLSNLGGESPGE